MKFIVPKNYINPADSQILEIDANSRIVSAREIQNPIIDGVKLCAWCAATAVIGKKKYCSKECQISCYSYLTPQTLKGMYLHNQNFFCANCEFDYKPFFQQVVESYNFQKQLRGFIDQSITLQLKEYQEKTSYPSEWLTSLVQKILNKKNPLKVINIDHIKALALGGQGRGFNNLQAICLECHQKKTKLDMIRIRKNKAK